MRKVGAVPVLLVLLATGASAQETAPATRDDLRRRLVEAAVERTRHAVRYDGSYRRIPYPGGDVPSDVGVCTDEIVRIYRAVGIDLQKEVHEDMREHFELYPKRWGRRRPDANIDHRRVPNLEVFFRRHGEVLPITRDPQDYAAGDLVAYDLGGGVPHIGMVVEERGKRMLVHNIGAGPKKEDVLFGWKITGHFRYPSSSDDRRR